VYKCVDDRNLGLLENVDDAAAFVIDIELLSVMTYLYKASVLKLPPPARERRLLSAYAVYVVMVSVRYATLCLDFMAIPPPHSATPKAAMGCHEIHKQIDMIAAT
jgi:hypothetical protein